MLTKREKPADVAVYCRVSSEDQKEAGTIENQLDFGRRYCELHGLPVFDFYREDGVTGTIPLEDRPEGARLLKDAESRKFGAVLVYRVDRMARKARVLLDAHDRLSASDVALRSMTEPFDTGEAIGTFVMTLLAGLSELERASILERTAMGRDRAVRDGRWIGGPTPFGYRLEGTDHNRRLAIDEAEAAIVRRIFNEYVGNKLRLGKVAGILSAEGVPTPWMMKGIDTKRWAGRRLYRWSNGVVRGILRNSAYIGQYVAYKQAARKERTIISCPPIVDQDVFASAQQELQTRFIEATRNSKRFYLLRSLIRCRCERHPIMGGANCSADGKKYPYYQCPNCRLRLRARELEDTVWQDIVNFVHEPGDVLDRVRERLMGDAIAEEDLRGEIVSVDRQINELREQKLVYARQNARKLLDDAAFEQLMDEASRDVDALEAKRQIFFQRQAAAQARQAALLSGEALLISLRDRVDNADDDTKRELVKALVAGIRVEEDGTPTVTYSFAAPANCKLNVNPFSLLQPSQPS